MTEHHLSRKQAAILTVLRDEPGNAYGVTIHDRTRARGRRLSYGTIYVELHRLEEMGLVRSWWGERTPERGWRRKRYYAATPAGTDAMRSHEDRAALDREPWWRRLFSPRLAAGS